VVAPGKTEFCYLKKLKYHADIEVKYELKDDFEVA